MSKGSKSSNNNRKYEKDKPQNNPQASQNKQIKAALSDSDYLISMSMAPRLGEGVHWFQMLPVLFFTTIIVMIVRMASYTRPMSQFYFLNPSNSDKLTDFFSYYKMVAIIICASVVLLILLYKVFTQSFYVKRSFAYIPMLIYVVFVLLSYFFSDYKMFALWGWTDRFEGTVSLISYMVMLFYIINYISSEKNVKWTVNLLAVVSTILGILGVTQALNHDFFRTHLGKMMITPSSFWGSLDSLNFTFTNQIYQTVYNINYVSFYLTLLIPIFGLLFIRSFMLGKEEPIYRKIIWGALFALLIFNLIGSASSGGLMGMAFVVLVAVIVLNKRIVAWWKPVVILIALTVIIAGISADRWMPELTNAVKGVTGAQEKQAEQTDTRHKIDYIVTSGNAIELGYQGNELIFTTYPNDPSSLNITDAKGNNMAVTQISGDHPQFQLQDSRFDWITFKPARDDSGANYIIITTDGYDWPFMITDKGIRYRTGLGRFVEIPKVPTVGWENNFDFGSGRGFIWSRTIPMLKDTVILGHGADTYCIYFPQYDFAGKYDTNSFGNNPNIIVDKPHNMYFGAIVGTGWISMLALLALWGIYLVQSIKIYWKENFSGYLAFVGSGIFLGICGFLLSGIVDDSSVSVMPMFYGLLGTGIAINMMLKRQITD